MHVNSYHNNVKYLFEISFSCWDFKRLIDSLALNIFYDRDWETKGHISQKVPKEVYNLIPVLEATILVA